MANYFALAALPPTMFPWNFASLTFPLCLSYHLYIICYHYMYLRSSINHCGSYFCQRFKRGLKHVSIFSAVHDNFENKMW